MEKTTKDINSILDSIASSTRLKILKLLSKKEMGYSELMDSLGLEKNRDAGKFSYHLKKLLNTGLIDVNKESGKYKVSREGLTVLESLENLEKILGSREMMMVRRSDNLVEPFDKSKIINSLIREANITLKLASEIASIVEEKLKDLRIEYLTSSLIRELVNNVLLDMGLEKYRHRLTRVGMPIYDVSKNLKMISYTGDMREFLEKSSESIMREYCLQDTLPRTIAETYLKGEIDLYPLENWLTGIIARSYPAPDNDEKTLELLTEISSYMVNIKHEINIRVNNGEELENIFKVIRYIYLEGLLKKRFFSLTIHFEDLSQNYEKILDKVKKIEGVVDKVKLAVIMDNPSYSDLQKLNEASKNLGLEYAVTNSSETLFSGFKLISREPFSDAHAIFTINALSIILESNKNIEYILERVKELTMHGLAALSRRTRTFKQIYGKKYSGEITYFSSLCGLFNALKILFRAGPQTSDESNTLMNEILRTFRDSVKRETSKIGNILISSRIARTSAQRMLTSTYRKLGLDISKNVSQYNFLILPPDEKFKNIDERASIEREIASYIDGGYTTIVKGLRKRKILEEALILFEVLSKTGKAFTIKFEE
ncbi:MAG: helix-turn-helix domain-containing protein [Nitrososphaeria archaeon]|nr:helix-turn-helix domain-containing protein [Nitrososphaeria archaeon]